MFSKKNIKMMEEKNRDEKQRFSIRKLTIGAASVLVGVSFFMTGGQSVQASDDKADTIDKSVVLQTNNSSSASTSEEVLTDLQASQASVVVTEESKEDNTGGNVNAKNKDNTAQFSSAVTSADQNSDKSQTKATENSVGEKTKTGTEDTQTADADNTTNKKEGTQATKETSESTGDALKAVPVIPHAAAVETAEDTNSIDVATPQEFINAIQKGTATTINIVKDINLGEVSTGKSQPNISNRRDITIQSKDGSKKTIDFNYYSFNMNSDNAITFKDLTIYGRNWFGVVENANSYTFDNIDYTGSELVYTTRSASVTFKNEVSAHSVENYISPLDGKNYKTDGRQQVLQFTTGTNDIIFETGSNVTLETDNGNVIQNQGTATITVKNGANVTLNPHASSTNFEGAVSQVARAIYSKGGSINVEKGGNLVINLSQNSGDPYMPGAFYLLSGATINNDGNIKINVDGQPSTGNSMPVYLSGDSTVNVGNGATFEISAQNLGSYALSLFKVDGKGTVNLNPHSTFKISGDGTGNLTGIELGTGSTFTSDQPDAFTIDFTKNTATGKSLIKNGTINFSRVKTVSANRVKSDPLGAIDVTFDKNGKVTNYKITALNEDTVKTVADQIENKELINLIAAGQDVTLTNLHLDKNNKLTGTVSSPASDSNSPVYVIVEIGSQNFTVGTIGGGSYLVYTNTNGTITNAPVNYSAKTTATGGNFSIDLSSMASELNNDTQITVYGTKDFVESEHKTSTVETLRTVDTNELQELVDAAPAEKEKASYYNATEAEQKAYTDAITAGQNILNDPTKYDQSDIDAAVTKIQDAQKALSGVATDKTALQEAVNNSSSVKASIDYTSASQEAQTAYDTAVSEAQIVLKNDKATQKQVNDALDKIKAAQTGLNGAINDAKNNASEAIDKALADKTKEINDATNIDQATKEQLIKDATEAANNAKEAINNATTNDDVESAKNEGIENINKVVVPARDVHPSNPGTNVPVSPTTPSTDKDLNDQKNSAIDEINKAANDKKAEIDKSDLPQSEKDKLKEQVDKEVSDAIDRINNAKTADELKTIMPKSLKSIRDIGRNFVIKKVMHKSIVYNKHGKKTAKRISRYTNKSFVAKNGKLKVYRIHGEHFYKLAKQNGYVRVRNVTGSKMTLKRTSYVYTSNGKRTSLKDIRKLKRGSKITVYGGALSKGIKGYKRPVVRVGVNKYIKLSNVNYKLYK